MRFLRHATAETDKQTYRHEYRNTSRLSRGRSHNSGTVHFDIGLLPVLRSRVVCDFDMRHFRRTLTYLLTIFLYFSKSNQVKPCALTAENARLVSISSSNIDLCVMSVIILSVNNYKRADMII